MKVVIQRVKQANVLVEQTSNRAIGQGLMILLGVMEGDGEEQALFLAKKVSALRIFSDENDKMNRSVLDIGGSVLVVSNFTLGADCKKGNRPSFVKSAHPSVAEGLYQLFVQELRKLPLCDVQTGEFGAHMDVALTNDGPITIVIDTAEIGK